MKSGKGMEGKNGKIDSEFNREMENTEMFQK